MAEPAHRRPNVLFVMVDQWAGPLLGCAGHPVIQTPTMDHLARLGIRFGRAYTESPVCIPARRTIMTGTTPRRHGDRSFQPGAPMPELPLLAQCFRDAGYQAYAVGKLHVYPQRNRIGFDDVRLAEEGRPQLGAVDDYDLFLADQGFAGQQFLHGMTNETLIAGFASSLEYYNGKGHGDPTTWVISIYEDILHRAPSTGETAYWADQV